MADLKISALTSATTPLAGTEVLPIVQSSTTKKVSTDDLTVKNIRSNATSGILQVAGPAAASTRVMTTPDANFSAARIDAGQSFFGIQRFANNTDNDASIDIYGASTGGDPYMKGYDRNGATNFEFICDTGTTDRRFDYYGKVRVYNANFVVGTAGNGIDFSATSGTGTSELLADYEEGTWTPSLTGSTSGSATSGGNTYGNYTKVGRLVTLNFVITISAVSTLTGNVMLSGLPFNLAAGGAFENRYPQGATIFGSLGTLWASIVIGSDGGTTTLAFTGTKIPATGTTNVTAADLTATSFFAGSIQYIA